LCKVEPPITDIDTLDILFKTLQKLDGQDATRSNLWERAAKATPQDLEIQGRWFTYAFESNDWKSAQKVSTSDNSDESQSAPEISPWFADKRLLSGLRLP
jgi:N-terminal acetyltransferase B complex non-catalytic subunit